MAVYVMNVHLKVHKKVRSAFYVDKESQKYMKLIKMIKAIILRFIVKLELFDFLIYIYLDRNYYVLFLTFYCYITIVILFYKYAETNTILKIRHNFIDLLNILFK